MVKSISRCMVVKTNVMIGARSSYLLPGDLRLDLIFNKRFISVYIVNYIASYFRHAKAAIINNQTIFAIVHF